MCLAALLAAPTPAQAIPAFARDTGLGCAACHRAYPELTPFGKGFAADGYLLGAAVQGRRLETGDKDLSLAEKLPLALRLQFDLLSRPAPASRLDFQAPIIAKLLSGGAISKNVNYYAYFLLAEYGATGGLEDAWVRVHDAPIPGLGLQLGQFQISDLVFPRELRLTRQDYLVYTASQSASGFNLAYARGVNVDYGIGPVGLAAGVVNGNGLDPARRAFPYAGRATRVFDDDRAKVGYARLGAEFAGLSAGWFGLQGAEGRERNANRFWRTGPDAEYIRGPVRFFGQVLTGTDDNPALGARGAALRGSRLWGGLAGGSYLIHRRWVTALLYNRLLSERPGIAASLGTLNVSYYLRRNFKLGVEGTYDFLPERGNHPEAEHTVIGFADFAY